MKRRLSCAIAAIGDPDIIFLDEPTTGMDPVNKQGVWHLIQDMKKDRVIILTTHSMEEADVLADRIGIMAFGKIREVDSPMLLKNRYSNGYRLSIVRNSDVAIEDVTEFVYVYLYSNHRSTLILKLLYWLRIAIV